MMPIAQGVGSTMAARPLSCLAPNPTLNPKLRLNLTTGLTMDALASSCDRVRVTG